MNTEMYSSVYVWLVESFHGTALANTGQHFTVFINIYTLLWIDFAVEIAAQVSKQISSSTVVSVLFMLVIIKKKAKESCRHRIICFWGKKTALMS